MGVSPEVFFNHLRFHIDGFKAEDFSVKLIRVGESIYTKNERILEDQDDSSFLKYSLVELEF